MQTQSANPMDYMSPLWTILIVVVVILIVLWAVAKPLHQYITDRKTRKLIGDMKTDAGAAGTEPPVPAEDKPEDKPEEKPEGGTGDKPEGKAEDKAEDKGEK
jgi:Sec-independent protein translocase protein TatA